MPAVPWRGALAALVVVSGLVLLWTAGLVAAHEIPEDVTVHSWLKPEGTRLRLLVRAPLEAMADMEWPTRGPGYLDLARAEAMLDDAATVWLANDFEIYEGAARLPRPTIVAARVSLPSDRSFESYEAALEHVLGPRLAEETSLYWQQAVLDVEFEYPIRSGRSEFSVHPDLDRLGLRVTTVLRFVLPDGGVRAFEFRGDPGTVRLDPRWYQAGVRFVRMGFLHILDGTDHLLFLLCLVIPFRRLRPLVVVVTSFTVAHSITLAASALDLAPDALWFPPLVETLIAMSIVYMALENIAGSNVKRRWVITFGFGLVHGFGFAFVLGETMQFAGAHLATSLVAFNVGVELGQIFVLLFAAPALALLFRYAVAERTGTIILSALVAHTAWHWMMERWDILSQYPWPDPDSAAMAAAMSWVILVLMAGGATWLAAEVVRRRLGRSARSDGVVRTGN